MAKLKTKIIVKNDIKLTLEKLYELYNKADNMEDKLKYHALITIELNK